MYELHCNLWHYCHWCLLSNFSPWNHIAWMYKYLCWLVGILRCAYYFCIGLNEFLLDLDCSIVSFGSCANSSYPEYVFYAFLQCIINFQALPCLLNLLTHNHKKSIKKEACWTISNITAGNKDQIQVRGRTLLFSVFNLKFSGLVNAAFCSTSVLNRIVEDITRTCSSCHKPGRLTTWIFSSWINICV